MSHQASKDKPRSSKCRHFCLPFDSHNYCPACREANKGDDPCVTLEKPCEICSGFSEEQWLKIKNRRRYVWKQKATDTSKDDDLDLLEDEDMESFSGLHADLEGATDNLFASPPHPQHLRFEALSLKTPAKTVPPTPGTALQQKIESKLEKSLGSQFNIQLQQQMGAFQASMLEAVKSLRDEMQSIKKSAKEVELDQSSTSASKPAEVELDQSSTSASKPAPSKQSDNLPPNTAPNTQSERTDETMELGRVWSISSTTVRRYSVQTWLRSLRYIRTTRTGVFVQSQKTFGQTQTQGSGQIYFSIVIHRGGSVLCSQEKVFSAP